MGLRTRVLSSVPARLLLCLGLLGPGLPGCRSGTPESIAGPENLRADLPVNTREPAPEDSLPPTFVLFRDKDGQLKFYQAIRTDIPDGAKPAEILLCPEYRRAPVPPGQVKGETLRQEIALHGPLWQLPPVSEARYGTRLLDRTERSLGPGTWVQEDQP